jgi:hypothetical protein
MSIAAATQVSDELLALFSDATNAATHHRGGAAMLESVLSSDEPEAFLRNAIARNEVWIARTDQGIVGFALCRNSLIEAVYVGKASRRQGVATQLITAIIHATDQPLDAYALPGDRATKSFFESLGWKARLLTMRDA